MIKIEDLRKYKVVESRTDSALSSSATPVASPDGRIGEALFVVHLVLLRTWVGAEQKIVLAKSTIVVKFDHEVVRGGRDEAARR